MSTPPLSDLPEAPGSAETAGQSPVRPRRTVTDAFEQNPLSSLPERISLQAAEGMDDAGRVREALRAVIADGLPLAEAARRCGVAPSFLAEWQGRYLALLSEDTSIATGPLMETGGISGNADLVSIPQAAIARFSDNWDRLMEQTHATPSTFRQSPLRLFLENSALTRWMFENGKLDRGALAGVVVVLSVLVITFTFFTRGETYQPAGTRPPPPENLDDTIRLAAETGKQFFRAATFEEKAGYVRAEGPVRALMEEYFRDHPPVSLPDSVLKAAIPDAQRMLVELAIPSLGRSHMWAVIHSGGGWLLDWESSSLFQEYNLEKLFRTRPSAPTRIAVKVESGSYYNFGFTPDLYHCYEVSYPGVKADLFAYARKGSAEDTTLQTLVSPMEGAERYTTAILEVKYPAPDAEANQVELVRIVADDWVAPSASTPP